MAFSLHHENIYTGFPRFAADSVRGGCSGWILHTQHCTPTAYSGLLQPQRISFNYFTGRCVCKMIVLEFRYKLGGFHARYQPMVSNDNRITLRGWQAIVLYCGWRRSVSMSFLDVSSIQGPQRRPFTTKVPLKFCAKFHTHVRRTSIRNA